MTQTWLWAGFVAAVGAMLALDLGLLNRHAHAPSIKESAIWSGIWVALALAFGGAIWWLQGSERAMLYFTGYVLEKSLSVDNLFVFLILFRFFGVTPEHQPRVLHWGILGAIALRFIFIFAGVAAVHRARWLLAIFGVLLLYTGAKILFAPADEVEPHKHPALHLLHRFLPVTEGLHGQHFFTRLEGRLYATPLFAALVLVEASDIVFAADSIPAALAVTPDLFLVYTSNIFAVMGLRALYFLLESSLQEFKHLRKGISLALIYVGAKLLVHRWVEIPTWISLVFVAGVIGLSVVASLLDRRKEARP